MTGQRRVIRCAIYTRKSSEEGLEQGFNSLEAQREACAAYIKSQAHEGWRALPERYDDGGHSGGTLERPAVQQLLEQVKARKLDIIVLYKIDRLTRSLTDFAKLAELFDAHGVSFVSVTQQFNTTTSMGRLMLNVLLSFAQFEREITGERIRDKVAASKRKGIWMGGFVPLGYEVKNRALVVVPREAETVRTIYRLYLKLGTVPAVKRELDRLGLRTKQRAGVPGRWQGNRPFWPGHLYNLLGNPIYAGRIKHKDEVHPGMHQAIIDPETWDEVQRRLKANLQGERRKGRPETRSLLTGLLFDAEGNRFTPSHSVKDGRRYRYYVDRALVTGQKGKTKHRRIPAEEIERIVRDAVLGLLEDRTALIAALGEEVGAHGLKAVLQEAIEVCRTIADGGPSAAHGMIQPLLHRVMLEGNRVRVSIQSDRLQHLLKITPPHLREGEGSNRQELRTYDLAVPAQVTTGGQRLKLVVTDEAGSKRQTDPVLIKAIARAQFWFEQLRSGQRQTVTEIARSEQLTETYVSRVLKLAFLEPKLVEAAFGGRLLQGLTTADLLLVPEFPWRWAEQRSVRLLRTFGS